MLLPLKSFSLLFYFTDDEEKKERMQKVRKKRAERNESLLAAKGESSAGELFSDAL